MSSRQEREPRRRERRTERNDSAGRERQLPTPTNSNTPNSSIPSPRQVPGSRERPAGEEQRQRARSRRRGEGREEVPTERLERSPPTPVRGRTERENSETSARPSQPRIRRTSGERERIRRNRLDSNDSARGDIAPAAERLARSRVDSARTAGSGLESPRSKTTENTLLNSVRSEGAVSSRSSERTRIPRNRSRSRQDAIKPIVSEFKDFMGAAAAVKIGSLFADDTITNYTSDSNVPDLTDNITFNSILMQATTDSEGFTVLLPEKYLEQKKRLVQITNYFESLQNKLSLEFKVKEATENILKFNSNDGSQAEEARKQLALSESKMKDISKELWVVVGDLIQVERTVMKHVGGALRWKVTEFSQSMSNAPTLRLKKPDEDAKRQLTSAEDRVKELEAQVEVLKSTISRLELSQEPLRELASSAQRNVRRAQEEKDIIDNTPPGSAPTSLAFNKMKLDYATTRVELSDTKEELLALRDSQAKLQLQLEEDQGLLQSKDRQISNLLTELEEATNKIEMSRAGGKITDAMINGNASLSRMMGRKKVPYASSADTEQFSNVLASQLKEAVLEREKLKLKLDQEIERNQNLEERLNAADLGDTSSASAQSNSRRQPARGDAREQQRLAAVQKNIEEFLKLTRSAYSVPKLTDLVTKLIQSSRDLNAEHAILKDSISRLESESKLSKSRNPSDKANSQLQDELDQMKRRLNESERLAARLPELQSIIEGQAEKLKNFNSQRDKDIDATSAELENAKSSFKADMANLREKYESQIAELVKEHEADLSAYKAKLDQEKLDILNNQDREIENSKSKWEAESNAAFDQKMALLKRQQEAKIQEVTALAELEKTEFKSQFQKDQIESKNRLEAAEQALVDSKQQFFSQREKLQEKIDSLESEVEKLQNQTNSSAQEYANRKNDLQQKIDDLYDEVDVLTSSVKEANRKLEAKSRELNEIHGLHELEIKQISQEFETKILGLESTISQLEDSQKSLQKVNADAEETKKNLEADILRLQGEAADIKAKAARDVNSAQESLFDATDQLERNQRLLRDINSDVDRYRKMAEELDGEVLTLKRQLRAKEKELTEGAMSGSPESSNVRRIIEQKDKEIESVRSELRSCKGEVSSLNRKLEVKDREIEDAKKSMQRAAGGDKDEQSEEIARLQIMLLDLKTTRVDLLEKLDDAEHETEMLKKEIKVLKGT